MAIGGFGVAFYKGYSYQGHHTSTLWCFTLSNNTLANETNGGNTHTSTPCSGQGPHRQVIEQSEYNSCLTEVLGDDSQVPGSVALGYSSKQDTGVGSGADYLIPSRIILEQGDIRIHGWRFQGSRIPAKEDKVSRVCNIA
jgi:hypothetical protein